MTQHGGTEIVVPFRFVSCHNLEYFICVFVFAGGLEDGEKIGEEGFHSAWIPLLDGPTELGVEQGVSEKGYTMQENCVPGLWTFDVRSIIECELGSSQELLCCDSSSRLDEIFHCEVVGIEFEERAVALALLFLPVWEPLGNMQMCHRSHVQLNMKFSFVKVGRIQLHRLAAEGNTGVDDGEFVLIYSIVPPFAT